MKKQKQQKKIYHANIALPLTKTAHTVLTLTKKEFPGGFKWNLR